LDHLVVNFSKLILWIGVLLATLYYAGSLMFSSSGVHEPALDISDAVEESQVSGGTVEPTARTASPAAAPCSLKPAIYRPTFSDGLAGRLPLNQLISYDPARSQMIFYTEIIGAADQQVKHTWFSGQSAIAEYSFEPENDRWPTWSTQDLAGVAGESLRVEVHADTCLIGEAMIRADGEQVAEAGETGGWMRPQQAIEVILAKPQIDYASTASRTAFVDDLTESGDTLLLAAIRAGDTAEALMLIEKNTDVERPPDVPFKEIDAWYGRRYRKADPFLRGPDGISPIQLAHDMGNDVVVEALIESAITRYLLNRKTARYGGFRDTTLKAMLVNRNGFMRFDDGDTPLLRAVRTNNERAVLTLLRLSGWKDQTERYDPLVDLYAYDANGKQALTIAREQGLYAIERFLLLAMSRKEPGWAVSRSTLTTGIEDGEPADCRGSAFEDEQRIHYFTELTDMDGKRIVHEWRRDREPVLRKEFAVTGRRWSTHSSREFSPADVGMWEVAVLSENGEELHVDRLHYQELTDYNRRNRDRMNAPCNMGGGAFIAQFKAQASSAELEYLLDKGMELKPRNSVGEFVYNQAIVDSNVRLLGWLLDHGFDVNAYAKGAKTPLMMAAENDSGALALFLISRGANLEFKSYRDGATALQVAVVYHNSELAELLLKQGAHANAPDSQGYTPLHSAVGRCDLPSTLVLLEYGADPAIANKKGEKPGASLTQCESMERWDSKHPALAPLYAGLIN
jgi:ankyrin repeat protein